MKTVKLDFISDYICPWCYIAKIRLYKIMQSLQHNINIELNLKPYILYPNIPEGGIAKSSFANKSKAGMGKSLRKEAAIEGISINYKLIDVIPNSLAAHRLTQLLTDESQKYELAISIFRAYFEYGENIEDSKILAKYAKLNNLNPDLVNSYLNSDVGLDETKTSIASTRLEYINVVPSIKFNNSFVLSGLQSSEVWKNYITRAAT